MKPYLNNPLIVALDVDEEVKARQLASDLTEIAGGFKLGPRLLLKTGSRLVRDLAEKAPVFMDCKFFDIPSTMESAVRSCFDAGATLVTVHTLAGKEALDRLAKLERDLHSIRPFKILCVTVLTSWSEESKPKMFTGRKISEDVRDLSQMVVDSGLSGIVCSPEELDLFPAGNSLFKVTPGIRFSLQDRADQKRVMGPKEAMEKGATALVVGRPILEAANPVEAALDFQMAILDSKTAGPKKTVAGT